MIVNITPRTTETDRWSTAEFIDHNLPGGLTLRALVCPLASGEWQWSISSLDGTRGELICTGIERSSADARLTAVAEIAKCLTDAMA